MPDRFALEQEAAAAILTAIAEAAPRYNARGLRDLAEAFALVTGSTTPVVTSGGPTVFEK